MILKTIGILLKVVVFLDLALALDKRIKVIELGEFCHEKTCSDIQYPEEDDYLYFETHKINETYQLAFENCQFANFPLNLFETLHLETLVMDNCSVKTLNADSFKLAGDLMQLSLAFNKIEEIPSGVFQQAVSLDTLVLAVNRIIKLHDKSFEGLNHLTRLILSYNRIESLPPQVFNLPKLQLLDLQANKLKQIPNDLFAKTPNLVFINLNKNELENAESNVFSHLGENLLINLSSNRRIKSLNFNFKLKAVIAEHCDLHEVVFQEPVSTLVLSNNSLEDGSIHVKHPSHVQELLLSDNKLQNISFFQDFINLKELLLNGNPFDWDLVKNLNFSFPKLRKLNLSNTGISFLPTRLLEKSQVLFHLDISGNKIHQVDFQSLGVKPKLDFFYFHKNPWYCESLKDFMDNFIYVNKIGIEKDQHDETSDNVKGVKCSPQPQVKEEPNKEEKPKVEVCAVYDEDMKAVLQKLSKLEKLLEAMTKKIEKFDT